MAKIEGILKKQAEEIFEKMGFKVQVSVELVDKDDHYRVEIKPENEDDLPLLIGYHGQTLNALQVILGLLLFKESGSFHHILVEAGDYRKEREEEIKQRALEAADKARFLLKEVSFPAMPPFERRIIHMALTEERGVTTESRGDGRERHVVVIPEGVKKVMDEK
jgi:spoIIIJ-associated protein